MGNSTSQELKPSVYLVKELEFLIKFDQESNSDGSEPCTYQSLTISQIKLESVTAGSGKGSLFDIDSLKKTINVYQQGEERDKVFLSFVGVKQQSTYCLDVRLSKDIFDKLRVILVNPYIKIEGEIRKEELKGFLWERKKAEPFSVSFNCEEACKLTASNNVCKVPFGEFSPGIRNRERDRVKVQCKILLEWTSSPDSLRTPSDTTGRNLFNDDTTKDVILVACNDAEIKCHSLILQTYSPVFKSMLSTSTGMSEFQTRRIELRSMSETGLNQLLRYLYGIEMAELTSEVAAEMFMASHQYGLSQLENDLGKLLLKKNSKWYGPNIAVELYFFVKKVGSYDDLLEYLLVNMARYFFRMHQEIRTCDRFTELEKEDADDMVWKLLDVKSKVCGKCSASC